ncbi:hypothetical protein CEP52_008887 [Fusarium oligoseptatum]|uniref:SnoaL-like domain-containing protein n=1 Tax=Fusarium oligoseptatum TaxID=2604345 RepID=A0A428TFM5_9HYPO|nr:hypothetical protein CEP52_008887 [Fusarium oligoseptatum]
MSVPPDVVALITHKKAQYCHSADSNQWEVFEKVFLPEATFIFVDAKDEVINVDRECNSFKVQQTIHLVGPGEFEQISPEEIKVTWSVIYHCGPRNSETEGHGTGGGHYHEVWKKRDGDWFMASMRMKRLYWRT